MNRSAWQCDFLLELGELASQLAHPTHDRLAAGSEPAACEADRVTQLAEGSVVVEGFGRTGFPDCFERSVHASELLEYADVGVLVRPWLHVIDELLKLSPTISDPQEVIAGNRNRPSDADLRPLEPFPQAPQSRDSPAADPGPVNPEDHRRLSVYPQVEVEPTADVCPSGPARDAGDQGRDGRVIWAGSRSEPARQRRERGRSFDSGHSNGPPVHPRKGPPASMVQILPRRCIDRRDGEGSKGASGPCLACRFFGICTRWRAGMRRWPCRCRTWQPTVTLRGYPSRSWAKH